MEILGDLLNEQVSEVEKSNSKVQNASFKRRYRIIILCCLFLLILLELLKSLKTMISWAASWDFENRICFSGHKVIKLRDANLPIQCASVLSRDMTRIKFFLCAFLIVYHAKITDCNVGETRSGFDVFDNWQERQIQATSTLKYPTLHDILKLQKVSLNSLSC